MKLDRSGKVLMAKAFGGHATDRGTDVAVDGSGNCYVLGRTGGLATFSSTSLSAGGVVLAKLDSAGAVVWVKGTAGGEGGTVEVDGAGKAVVAGSFRHTMSFASTSLSSAGYTDVYLWRTGEPTWDLSKVRIAPASPEVNRGGSIAFRAQGLNSWDNPIASGVTYSWSLADPQVGTIDSASGRFTATGPLGTYPGVVKVVATQGSVSKSGTASVRVVPDHAAAGWGGNLEEKGFGVAVDGAGFSYVTGHFSGTASFGGTTLTSGGGADGFLVKVKGDGAVVWARRLGGWGDGVADS